MATLHWFRKGLRVHDNPALLEACARNLPVYPVFVLDPHFLDPERVGVLRMVFLLESLRALDARLGVLGCRLYVLKGAPAVELAAAWERWGVDHMTYETDTEPYAMTRDSLVATTAAQAGVSVSAHTSHTLHPPSAYLMKKQTTLPTTFTQFQQRFQAVGVPPAPVAVPVTVPAGDLCAGLYKVPRRAPSYRMGVSPASYGFPQPAFRVTATTLPAPMFSPTHRFGQNGFTAGNRSYSFIFPLSVIGACRAGAHSRRYRLSRAGSGPATAISRRRSGRS